MGEAGQLGTVAAVLAVVKPGFMKAEACDGCAPHGRIPKSTSGQGFHRIPSYPGVCSVRRCGLQQHKECWLCQRGV